MNIKVKKEGELKGKRKRNKKDLGLIGNPGINKHLIELSRACTDALKNCETEKACRITQSLWKKLQKLGETEDDAFLSNNPKLKKKLEKLGFAHMKALFENDKERANNIRQEAIKLKE